MHRSAEERANIAQRKMSLKQGRLMAIFETMGGPPEDDDELQRAHQEAQEWVDRNTDAEGNLKPGAPGLQDGLEGWQNG